MKLLKYILAALALMLGLVLVPTLANAEDPVDCVPKDAWTEVIEHPAVTEIVHHDAVTEIVHHDAVTETVAGVWANWQPNDQQAPQDYTPVWPTDPRGTWIIHDQLPSGHEGSPDGVYRVGEGNSPWFYRQAEKVKVISEAYDEVVTVEEAYDEVVVVTEAWTETIEHDAVTCDDDDEPPVDDCPDGQVGTPPNCVDEDDDDEPPVEDCPDGQVGTPPSCEDDDDDKNPVPPGDNPGSPTGTPPTGNTGNPPTGGSGGLGSTGPAALAPTRDTPMIEKPGPGEEIVFQSFDSKGNLVEQRVSQPIPGVAQQEGM